MENQVIWLEIVGARTGETPGMVEHDTQKIKGTSVTITLSSALNIKEAIEPHLLEAKGTSAREGENSLPLLQRGSLTPWFLKQKVKSFPDYCYCLVSPPESYLIPGPTSLMFLSHS